MAGQVKSLNRKLATATRTASRQPKGSSDNKKNKKVIYMRRGSPIRVPPPVKVLPNSYLTVSPEGKVVEIAMPVHIDSKVVWARWP